MVSKTSHVAYSNNERRLVELFKTTPNRQADQDSKDRNLLLEGAGMDDLGVTTWGADENIVDEKQKVARREVMEKQDEGLDSLHEIIVRQKHLATTIGGEVETHNELLDDIGDTMEQTTQRLLDTTHGVRRVETRDSGTTCYWIIIIVLLIIIVVVGML